MSSCYGWEPARRVIGWWLVLPALRVLRVVPEMIGSGVPSRSGPVTGGRAGQREVWSRPGCRCVGRRDRPVSTAGDRAVAVEEAGGTRAEPGQLHWASGGQRRGEGRSSGPVSWQVPDRQDGDDDQHPQHQGSRDVAGKPARFAFRTMADDVLHGRVTSSARPWQRR
jgi:hypothetical protein